MSNSKIDRNKLDELGKKIGIKFIKINSEDDLKTKNVVYSKMLDISKPNRPGVREFFKRQSDVIK
ncbi:hypothetical protein [Clostridium thailandense]|uniref:hypothetical protein n=1 Tax=Clostridium thailandense TaxID=2794346 RepID=UPI003989DAE8